MWLIIGEKCVLSSVGILFNAILVVAIVKAKNLRSICNLLIAMDSAFLAMFQLNALITFLIALFGINFVPVSTCFYLQAVTMFAVLMSFCVMFQMGLERLANVLFPIWSMKENSKCFHAVFLLFSLCSNCYLIWLQYDMSRGVNKMVMCTASDITALGGLFYTIAFNRSVIMHILLIIIYVALLLILKFKKGLSPDPSGARKSGSGLVGVGNVGVGVGDDQIFRGRGRGRGSGSGFGVRG
uniref:G_PROTEIN_RECEP_F1_2 domain-containing protein n=1 Tax=Globodera pallida TaxID=36090 RepID=A0A183BYM8_GLOPA